MSLNQVGDRALELRRAFDSSFAEAPREALERTVDLLAIRIAGDAYVLRLGELSGLAAGRRITPLTSPAHGLLGLTSLRGNLVPVYGLGVLLGYAEAGMTRWLGLVGVDAVTAFAFEDFEGFLRVPQEAITTQQGEGNAGHVRELVRVTGQVMRVVHLPTMIGAVTERAHKVRSRKEG